MFLDCFVLVIDSFVSVSELINRSLPTMAREYDHLFKLLIIGDSGRS